MFDGRGAERRLRVPLRWTPDLSGRIAWLPKAASAIRRGEDPLSDIAIGVVDLGLGKNMVEALRCWVEAYGVATRRDGAWQLTPEGEAIFGEHGMDPFLEDPQTPRWLHWTIATRPVGRFLLGS